MSLPVNFRDLGGIAGADGRKVKEKKILRAGELVGLDADTRATLLDEYKLATVIDFRADFEREKRPNDDLPVKTVHIDIMKQAMDNKASMKSVESVTTVQEGIDHMLELYEMIVSSPHARRCYREFVEVFLAQEDGSALFHCFAGKDRTGIGAAVLLALLGAHEDDIMADYLLTNVLRAEANQALLAGRRDQMTDEQIEIFLNAMNVRPEYLQVAFDTAAKEFGSFEVFCRKGLDISDAQVETLRSKYLV